MISAGKSTQSILGQKYVSPSRVCTERASSDFANKKLVLEAVFSMTIKEKKARIARYIILFYLESIVVQHQHWWLAQAALQFLLLLVQDCPTKPATSEELIIVLQIHDVHETVETLMGPAELLVEQEVSLIGWLGRFRGRVVGLISGIGISSGIGLELT